MTTNKYAARQEDCQEVAFHGELLRQLRHLRGISADRLGKITDITTRHIYRLERNNRPKV